MEVRVMEKQNRIFRYANFKNLFLLLSIIGLVIAGCGGGGGGRGGVDTDETFAGDEGTGADGVAVFWKYFGGIGSGNAVEQTADGGFVFAGEKGSDYLFETKNAYLLKSDSLGKLAWGRSFGDDQGQTARDVKQCSDGGFIAVGYTDSGASRDVYVIRTNPAGSLIWSRTYDRQGEDDEGHAVCVLPGNEYAIAGSGGEDVWFFKIDDSGNKIPGSDRFYASSAPSWCRAYDMEMTNATGFVLTGRGGPNAIGVILTAVDGDVIWNNPYGTGIGYAVKQVPPPDEGLIVAGSTTPFDCEDSDVLIIKINAEGDEIWRRTFGGSGMDVGRSIAITPDGGYLIGGFTESFSQGNEPYLRNDVYLIKLATDGDVQWQKVKGQSPNNSELMNAIHETTDGGYIVTGSSQSQIMLAKFDKNGNTVKLGDLDFSFTVPDTIGDIQLTNAKEIAETVVSAVMTLIRTGMTGTALFISTLKGNDPTDFCDGGGSYQWSPAPANEIETYLLSFSSCASSDLDSTYTGGFFFTIQSLSGDLSGAAYDMTAEINPIDVTATDDAGDSDISGGLVFTSAMQSGTLSMYTASTGSPLIIAEDQADKSITAFGISSTQSESTGDYTIGLEDETMVVQSGYLGSPLNIRFQQMISGANDAEPDSGALLIEAQDGSRLTLTIQNGDVDLAVDTDGDGTDDGTISTSWTDLS
jgi:hypothetical protein